MLLVGSQLALLFRRCAAPGGTPSRRPRSGLLQDPFTGHLPGALPASKATAPGRPDEHLYDELLMPRYCALLDSPQSDVRAPTIGYGFRADSDRTCYHIR